jgi:hypothetical protein
MQPMTKQYRITTQNLTQNSENDCYLEPDDPIHELLIAGQLGGLGSQARLAEYNSITAERQRTKISPELEYAKSTGIRPGTPAWYALFPRGR